MDLKEKQWYLAEHIMDNFLYYNYFFEIGSSVKYISINLIDHSTSVVEESRGEFEENVLDNFEFNKKVPRKNVKREIVENIFI